MKFKVSALAALSFISICAGSYNPYKFRFSVEQYPCISFTYYFSKPTLSRDKDYEILYGADLDFYMTAGASYPPIYYWGILWSLFQSDEKILEQVNSSDTPNRNYLRNIDLVLYKYKNENEYHINAHIELLRQHNEVYEYDSGDVTIPQETVEILLSKAQFPVKTFPEKATKNDYYRFGAHSMEELSENQNLNAFKCFFELAKLAFKPKGIHIKFDENDLKIRLNFRKKWFSWDTWKRWEEWL
jgi:hypothetical protein